MTELKREMDISRTRIGTFNTLPSIIDEMIEDKKDLNNTINQLHLSEIYGILYPITTEYISFSRTSGTFSITNHMLSHKLSLI